MRYIDSNKYTMKYVIVIMLAASLFTGCSSSNFGFIDSSELSMNENTFEVINFKTNVKYPLRKDLLSPNYTGGYTLNFINQSNFNNRYAAYDLIKASINQLPFKDKRVEFVSADKFIILRLNNENQEWAPNYSLNINGDCVVELADEWNSKRKLQIGDFWRNLIISPSKKRVLCVDRLMLKGNFYAIVYIMQADKRNYPFPALYHWDVTQPELLPCIGITLEGFTDITRKIIVANQ